MVCDTAICMSAWQSELKIWRPIFSTTCMVQGSQMQVFSFTWEHNYWTTTKIEELTVNKNVASFYSYYEPEYFQQRILPSCLWESRRWEHLWLLWHIQCRPDILLVDSHMTYLLAQENLGRLYLPMVPCMGLDFSPEWIYERVINWLNDGVIEARAPMLSKQQHNHLCHVGSGVCLPLPTLTHAEYPTVDCLTTTVWNMVRIQKYR